MAILSPERTYIRPAAVAGSFYPADRFVLRERVQREIRSASPAVVAMATEGIVHPTIPKAIIVPHAGYTYSGSTAALAYALLERGRGEVTRAVIVGPTHRVAVRGVACCNASAFDTPLGAMTVDRDAEQYALDHAPAMIVNDDTHRQEHAVEVQLPFIRETLGNVEIVPLNAGDATPREVGDVLRALWGGPETVIIISSDLSHYYPHEKARHLDDQTIGRICECNLPINPDQACGAIPVNGLLDVCIEKGLHPVLLGRATSGDDNEVSVAGEPRVPIADTNEAVVGYASFAIWEAPRDGGADNAGSASARACATMAPMRTCAAGSFSPGSDDEDDTKDPPAVSSDEMPAIGAPSSAASASSYPSSPSHAQPAPHPHAIRTPVQAVRDALARQNAQRTQRPTGLAGLVKHTEEYAHLADDPETYASDPATNATGMIPLDAGNDLLVVARNAIARELNRPPVGEPSSSTSKWLDRKAATFVTLTENERLRGCIGTLRAREPLRDDVARHAVDAAFNDPRFAPVQNEEYPMLHIEVSVLSEPERIEGVRSRGDLLERLHPYSDGLVLRYGPHLATYLPQVWEQLSDPRDFVTHLLLKAGLPGDFWDERIVAERYSVITFSEPEK